MLFKPNMPCCVTKTNKGETLLQISDSVDRLDCKATEIINNVTPKYPEFANLLINKEIQLVEINTKESYKLMKVISPNLLITIS